MTATVWFWIAAALSLSMAGGHVVVAGAIVVRPLLDDATLPAQVKWLGYFSWHVVTLLAVAMTIGFSLVALDVASRDVAVLLSAVALGCAALGGALAIRARLPLHRFPPPVLFLLVGIVGAAGAVTHA